MIWNLISMPAAEELAGGYTPPLTVRDAPGNSHREAERNDFRRYLVALFIALGLIVGVESALIDHPTDGHRRLAEVNLAERKAECRDCQTAVDPSPRTEN